MGIAGSVIGWGESEGRAGAGGGGAGALARLGTGGGLLAALGRLTSEDTAEWVEPESREAELTEGERPVLEGTAHTGPSEEILLVPSGSIGGGAESGLVKDRQKEKEGQKGTGRWAFRQKSL